MRQRWVLIVVVAVGCAVSAYGDQAIESTLRAEFVDKIVIVRGFYEGSKLRFSSDGTLIGNAKPGYWTSEGMVKISDVSIDRGNVVVIKGRRILNVFDRKTGKFGNFTTRDNLQIELQTDPKSFDLRSITQALLKVFTPDVSELKTMTPDYWECWVNGRAQRSEKGYWICSGIKNLVSGTSSAQSGTEVSVAGPNPPRGPVFKVGKGVEPPRPLSTPDPDYPRAARASLIEGVTVLWAVIGEQGEVAQVSVERPLGAGLDDRAVEAVRTWRFEPAHRDRKPISVIINIEVNFRLH